MAHSVPSLFRQTLIYSAKQRQPIRTEIPAQRHNRRSPGRYQKFELYSDQRPPTCPMGGTATGSDGPLRAVGLKWNDDFDACSRGGGVAGEPARRGVANTLTSWRPAEFIRPLPPPEGLPGLRLSQPRKSEGRVTVADSSGGDAGRL